MIYKYMFKENHIVMDVNSGAVHVVDKIIYDVLDYYEEEDTSSIINLLENIYAEAEVRDAIEEISILVKTGLLFTDDSHITPDMFEKKEPIVKAICLHVAHDCNMSCQYCFGDQGAFEGDRTLMSFETGQKAIDFLFKNSGSRRNLEIDFFGGEPLMNFDVVKELVAYGRKHETEQNKSIRFTITTNGLLLDDAKMDFINEHMDNVILSIDGRPAVNDHMRKTLNGQGTYAVIVKNYKKFIKKRKGLYYVRGTFTRENLDFSQDVKHLVENGFRNVSIEPVVLNKAISFALQDSDLKRILSEYDKLADLYLDYAKKGKEFAFFHFKIDLEQGPCIIKRLSGCGAGTEYMAISPEGDLYPCHQFVGNKRFLIGNLYEAHCDNKLYDTFNSAHIYNKEACRKCWAKFYCSGGCHANAFNANGDIRKPYVLGCEMERKRVECAIGIKAELL